MTALNPGIISNFTLVMGYAHVVTYKTRSVLSILLRKIRCFLKTLDILQSAHVLSFRYAKWG